MQKLTLICLLTLSTAASAELIQSPRHPGSNLPFTTASSSYYGNPNSEDGVCRAMGYYSAVPGSSRTDSSFSSVDTIRVNSDGRVVAGPKTYVMSQIVCQGSRSNSFPDISFLINGQQLVHADSRLPFTTASSSYYGNPNSEDGVCRALGFERAASGSARTSNAHSSVDTLRLNQQGEVVAGPQTYAMDQIVCLNQLGYGAGSASYLIKGRDLVHPGSNLPFTTASSSYYGSPNSETGVCRALGFEAAAAGSARTDSSNSSVDTVKVDASGSVVSGPRTYKMSQIVCLDQPGRNVGSRPAPRLPREPRLPRASRNEPRLQERTILVSGQHLVDRSSGLPFTTASSSYYGSPNSEDGVCRALGYDQAVAGSSRTESSNSSYDTIRVNSFGVAVSGPKTYRMSQIVCLLK